MSLFSKFIERIWMTNPKNKKDLRPPVFDYDDFLDRIDGDVDLLKEVIEIFLKDTPGLLADLYAAIRSGNARAVERAAHTLKGTAANISAKKLQSLSQHVQSALKENNTADLEPFIGQFEKEFKELDRELKTYLGRQRRR